MPDNAAPPAAGDYRSIGADRIADERQRQIDVEGWTHTHDDEHSDYSLMWAACAYIDWTHAMSEELTDDADWQKSVLDDDGIPAVWPWHGSSWKPSDDPIRNLVKAGALIAAEIDRLERQRGLMTPQDAASPASEIECLMPDNADSQVRVDAFDFYAAPDPFDRFPWTIRNYVEGYPPERTDQVSISTPNGRRPDGTMHTYWSVAADLWEPIGVMICKAVNAEAHRRYGTPNPASVYADEQHPTPENLPSPA